MRDAGASDSIRLIGKALTIPAIREASFLEPFREVERADAAWSAAHLAASIAWMAALPLSNAAEGICFGILAAVAAIRVPSTWRLYGRLVRSGPFLLLAALFAWQAISVAWSSNPSVRWSSGMSRMGLVPLMLWPMSHRAGTLLAAMAGSGAVSASAVVGLNLRSEGVVRYSNSTLLGKDLGMTAACMSAALVASTVAVRRASVGLRLARAAVAFACTAGLLVLSKRSEFLAVPAAYLSGLAVSGRTVLRDHPAKTAALAVALAGAVIAAGMLTPRVRETTGQLMEIARTGNATTASLNDLTNGRAVPYLIAWEMFTDRPVTGWGARSFRSEVARRCEELRTRPGCATIDCTAIGTFSTSHNMVLDELSMRGAIGGLLLLALITSLVRWSWQDPDGGIALALVVLWCVHGMMNGATVRGTHLAMLAMLATRAALSAGVARR